MARIAPQGRQPNPDAPARRERLTTTVTPDELQAILDDAKREGSISLSDYIRRAALARATRDAIMR